MCRHAVVPLAPSYPKALLANADGLKVAIEDQRRHEELVRQEKLWVRDHAGQDLNFEPNYYPWCKKLSISKAGRIIAWALCDVKNPDDDCEEFQPRAGSGA